MTAIATPGVGKLYGLFRFYRSANADLPIPSDETGRCWGGFPVAYGASSDRIFSVLLLGLSVSLLAGCGHARQSMKNLDITAPKPGYVQVPPYDRPQLFQGTPLPGESSRSRREIFQERSACLGCGEVFWNSWHSDPPRPQDRISSHYPLEMVRGTIFSHPSPIAPLD